MKKYSDSRGTALLITLGVLMMLSVTGMAFVRIAKLERMASSNVVDTLRARLAALAGIEMAIAELRNDGINRNYDALNPGDPHPQSWIVFDAGGKDSLAGIPFGSAVYPKLSFSSPPHTFSGTLPSTYEPNGDYYQLKIYDCASQININMVSSRLNRILANLGASLEVLGNGGSESNIIQQMYTEVSVSKGQGIFNPLPQTLVDRIVPPSPAPRIIYKQKEDLISYFNAEWPANPTKATVAYNLVKDFVTIHSWIDPNSSVVNNIPTQPENMPLYQTKVCAPINVNTASRPVLEAVLTGLEARMPYFVTTDLRVASDAIADGGIPGLTEVRYNDYKQQFITIDGFDRAIASSIAQNIMEERWNNPFKSWEQFEAFIDDTAKLPDGSLPPFPGTSGLTSSVWKRACRDLLKANFNPNLREARFNPNKACGLLISKGDLNNGANATNTTEFCFSSMGQFEVSSAGIITANGGERVARAYVNVNVRIFSILTHTTQEDFQCRVNPSFTNTATLPVNMMDITNAGGTATLYSLTNKGWNTGWVEPLPVDSTGLPIDTPIFQLSFNPNTVAATPSSNIQLNAESSIGGGDKTTCIETIPERNTSTRPDRQGNPSRDAINGSVLGLLGIYNKATDTDCSDLMVDGYFSHYLREKYLWYKASPSIFRGNPDATNQQLEYDRVNYQNDYNISYYEGAVEFWVKLAIDSKVQTPCGILGVTQVIALDADDTYAHEIGKTDHTQIPNWKEGVQFFIQKTAGDGTQSKLRVSRVYFGIYGWTDYTNMVGGRYTAEPVGMESIDQVDKWTDNGDTDHPRFVVARKELDVDIDWRAHEWHHVVVRWREKNPPITTLPPATNMVNMDCYVDGTQPAQTLRFTPEVSKDSDPNIVDANGNHKPMEGVLAQLNAVMPRDSLYVGGFVRYQMEPDGIFKFAGTALLPLNGTIDAFRCYKSYDITVPNQAPERYSRATTYRYQNEIPIPNGAIQSGYLSWTVYRPLEDPVTRINYTSRPSAAISGCVIESTSAPTYSLLNNATQQQEDGAGGGSFSSDIVKSLDSSKAYKLCYQVDFTPPQAGSYYNAPAAFDEITLRYSKGVELLGWKEINQ